MPTQKRLNFSIICQKGDYFIRCDETLEKMTDKISSKTKALKIFKQQVVASTLTETLGKLSKKELEERVRIFKGRLRLEQKPWTLEEAKLVASLYSTRGEMYNKNNKLYTSSYHKRWLDIICAHMKPSRKKNKFVFSALNPTRALANFFECSSHYNFATQNQAAYQALRRYGIDTVELFENRDDINYIKKVLKLIAENNLELASTNVDNNV